MKSAVIVGVLLALVAGGTLTSQRSSERKVSDSSAAVPAQGATHKGGTAPDANVKSGRQNKTLTAPCGLRATSAALAIPARTAGPGEDTFRCFLGTGHSGEGVRALQTSLKACYGENVGVDGNFGADTVTALQRVQRKVGAKVDGRYGPQTRSKMQHAAATTGACGSFSRGAKSR